MNDLSSWCGTPSPANPCLIRITPGFYDLSDEGPLELRSYVDVAGSGRAVTRLWTDTVSGSVVNDGLLTAATYSGPGECSISSCEVRDLTLQVAPTGGGNVHALHLRGGTGVGVRNVGIEFNTSASSGGPSAILAEAGSDFELVKTDVTVDGSSGSALDCDNCQGRIRQCRFQTESDGSAASIFIRAGSKLTIEDCEIERFGVPTISKAIEVYLGDLALYRSSVRVGAAGTKAYAIYGQSDGTTRLQIIDSRVYSNSSGSHDRTAVFGFKMGIDISGSLIQAYSTSGTNTAIEPLAPPFLEVRNSRVIGAQYGISATWASGGPYFVNVRDSLLQGSTTPITAHSSHVTRVAFSELKGGAAGSFVQCRATVDESFTWTAIGCP